MDFMRNQNLGISIDQTLIIKAPLLTDATTAQNFEPFANEVLQLPSVKGVTYASSFPGAEINWHRTDITLEQENADYRFNSRIISIGNEFLDVFEIPLLAGQNFLQQNEGDKKGMLINERACKMFGFTSDNDALNKLVFIGNRKFEIVGVVEDYHFRSFQYQLQPILYIQGFPRNPNYAIKIGDENVSETIASIESRWKDAYHGNVFSYTFLDDSFEKEYENEKQLGAIVGILTLLALIISCSGLFGLSIYAVNQRTKEIGIRKVFGATVFSIVVLLSRNFAKLMIAGGLIAIPLVYVGVNSWLDSYAYKMPLDGWLFVVPLLIVMLLVWFTISFKAITAAKRNPIEVMKYE
jgi:putative ABC transport system permease protein